VIGQETRDRTKWQEMHDMVKVHMERESIEGAQSLRSAHILTLSDPLFNRWTKSA
jgi:hypothetical protein